MANPFHEGERAVQQRAGVADMAARIGNSIHAAIPARAREFLGEQPFMVLASRDAEGRVWASVIVGAPGFLDAPDERTLAIAESDLVSSRIEMLVSTMKKVRMRMIFFRIGTSLEPHGNKALNLRRTPR